MSSSMAITVDKKYYNRNKSDVKMSLKKFDFNDLISVNYLVV
jgi:hypothetical protein